jgi:hypothetical protein
MGGALTHGGRRACFSNAARSATRGNSITIISNGEINVGVEGDNIGDGDE